MSDILDKNRGYAGALKSILRLRYEPVAVKLIREGEEYPEGYEEPVGQLSHCQAVFRAGQGESFKLPLSCEN